MFRLPSVPEFRNIDGEPTLATCCGTNCSRLKHCRATVNLNRTVSRSLWCLLTARINILQFLFPRTNRPFSKMTATDLNELKLNRMKN